MFANWVSMISMTPSLFVYILSVPTPLMQTYQIFSLFPFFSCERSCVVPMLPGRTAVLRVSPPLPSPAVDTKAWGF